MSNRHPDADEAFWEIAEEEIRGGNEITVMVGGHAVSCSSMEQLNAARAEMENGEKPSHLPATAAWFRGYEAGQKRAKINQEVLEKRVREVAVIAHKQHKGHYTTESDATITLVLLRSLALAILGLEPPTPGSKEDAEFAKWIKGGG